MSTLYIDRKNTELRIEGKALVCYLEQARQTPIPLKLLDNIACISDVSLSSRILGKLAEHSISLHIVNPRNPRQQASLTGSFGNNPDLRLAQYQASLDQPLKTEIAKQLILAKLRNHHRWLEKLQQQRPEHRYSLSKATQQLQKTIAELEPKATSLESLRGIEGNAARTVFQCYADILPKQLEFTGRNRRPPRDPFNALLSLAYTLLHQRAVQNAYAAGLDPMIGFLHETKYSRDSLAADLIEPWRPHIERMLWEWVNSKYLRPEHFHHQQGACLLGKRGRSKFYAAFENHMKPLNRAMRWQINSLKKALLERYS